jgi:hypothetical protein
MRLGCEFKARPLRTTPELVAKSFGIGVSSLYSRPGEVVAPRSDGLPMPVTALKAHLGSSSGYRGLQPAWVGLGFILVLLLVCGLGGAWGWAIIEMTQFLVLQPLNELNQELLRLGV